MRHPFRKFGLIGGGVVLSVITSSNCRVGVVYRDPRRLRARRSVSSTSRWRVPPSSGFLGTRCSGFAFLLCSAFGVVPFAYTSSTVGGRWPGL